MNVAGFELAPMDIGVILTAVGTIVTAIAQLRTKRATDELRAGQVEKAGKIDTIEHAVTPNGGSSMRDRVNRIGDDITDLKTAIEQVVKAQAEAVTRDREHAERLAVLEDRTAAGTRPSTSRWRR